MCWRAVLALILGMLASETLPALTWEDLTRDEQAIWYQFLRERRPRFRSEENPFTLAQVANSSGHWASRLTPESVERLSAVFPQFRQMLQDGRDFRIRYIDGFIADADELYFGDGRVERNPAARLRQSYLNLVNTYRRYRTTLRDPNSARVMAETLTRVRFHYLDSEPIRDWSTEAIRYFQSRMNWLEQDEDRTRQRAELPREIVDEWRRAERIRMERQAGRIEAITHDRLGTDLVTLSATRPWSEGTAYLESVRRVARGNNLDALETLLRFNSATDEGQFLGALETQTARSEQRREEAISSFFGGPERTGGSLTPTAAGSQWMQDLGWWGLMSSPDYWRGRRPLWWRGSLRNFIDPQGFSSTLRNRIRQLGREVVDWATVAAFGLGFLGVAAAGAIAITQGVSYLVEPSIDAHLRPIPLVGRALGFGGSGGAPRAPAEKAETGGLSSRLAREQNNPRPAGGHTDTSQGIRFELKALGGKALSELPQEFEVPAREDLGFENVRYDAIPRTQPTFEVTTRMPQRPDSGRVVLPNVQGFDVTFSEIRQGDRVLRAGVDYTVRRSPQGMLAIHLNNHFDSSPITYTARYHPGGPTLPQLTVPELNQKEIASARSEARLMREAGMVPLANAIDRFLNDARGPVRLNELLRIIEHHSLYSNLEARRTMNDGQNPYREFRQFLNDAGQVCGDCDVVNAIGVAFGNRILDGRDGLRLELGYLVIRDPNSNILHEDQNHARLEIRSNLAPGRAVVDITPHTPDPRDPEASGRVQRLSRGLAPLITGSRISAGHGPRVVRPPLDMLHRFRSRGQLDLVPVLPPPQEGPPDPEAQIAELEARMAEPDPQVPQSPGDAELQAQYLARLRARAEAEVRALTQRNLQRDRALANLRQAQKTLNENVALVIPDAARIRTTMRYPHQVGSEITRILREYVEGRGSITRKALLTQLRDFAGPYAANGDLSEARLLAAVLARLQAQRGLLAPEMLNLESTNPHLPFVNEHIMRAVTALLTGAASSQWSPYETERSVADFMAELSRADLAQRVPPRGCVDFLGLSN